MTCLAPEAPNGAEAVQKHQAVRLSRSTKRCRAEAMSLCLPDHLLWLPGRMVQHEVCTPPRATHARFQAFMPQQSLCEQRPLDASKPASSIFQQVRRKLDAGGVESGGDLASRTSS